VKLPSVITRITFNNVLVATDFSPVSDSALRVAVEIARRYGSKLWMTNVISPAESASVPPEYWGSSQQMIEEAAERQLQELGGKLQDVPHEALLEHGGIAETIAGEVERLGVDLVVLGTHGREGFDRLMMGSVAEEVLRRVLCPVLILGPKVIAPVIGERGFKEILFATHFGPESFAAAPYAISLAQEFKTRLTLLHVMNEEDFDLPADPQIVLQNRAERLRKIIPADAELEHQSQFVVGFGKAAEQILSVARERNADLIVLGAKSANGHIVAATHLLSATAHKVVSHATCPVMTVHT
jgi:nucleotide-binding universal stress UspA family protein